MVTLIIDGGELGLPHAVGYYNTFPHEPSPEGDMLLGNPVVLNPITVINLLDELVKAGANGTAVVVCHGIPGGMLIPISTEPNSRKLISEAVEVLLQSSDGLESATEIRAMSQKTPAEEQAKHIAWQRLNEKFDLRMSGIWSLAEATKHFDDWLISQASKVGVSVAILKLVIAKAKAVQALNLDRLELRACNIGEDRPAMTRLKKFFGCKKFLAPKCETVFLPRLTVQPIVLHINNIQTPVGAPPSTIMANLTGYGFVRFFNFWTPYGWLPQHARFRIVGPSGVVSTPAPDPTTGDFEFNNVTVHVQKRVFHNGYSSLVIGIWEYSHYHFVGLAAGSATPLPNPPIGARHRADEPDWIHVGEIVRKLFMVSGSKYAGREFPLAGFWKPVGSNLPWLAPNEPAYLDQIVKV